MLNFSIVSVNEIAQTQFGTWHPANWPMMSRYLNPLADPFIDRINLLILNLRRQIELRSIENRNWILHRIGPVEECVLEAEYDSFAEMLHDTENIYRAYLFDHYFESAADSFMALSPSKLSLDSSPPLPVPVCYARDSVVTHGLSNALPFNMVKPISDNLQNGRGPTSTRFTEPHRGINLARERQFHRAWYRTGPQEARVSSSMNHLLYELSELSEDNNHLTGLSAKNRVFYINEAIPQPNRHTWLAWYSLVGISAGECYLKEAKTASRMFGLDYPHVQQFILPCLPMTQEHLSGHINPGDDSGGDNSLSARSAAHDRTPHGRIKHGRWEFITGFSGFKGSNSEERIDIIGSIDSIRFGNTTGRHLVQRQEDLLRFAVGNTDGIFDRDAAGVVYDPHLAYMHNMPLNLHYDNALPFDIGMRSLAKWFRVHFRFDETEFGALAAKEWIDAYMREAWDWIHRSDAAHLRNEFDAALIRQTLRAAPGKKESRGRKAKTDFGFDIIFGSESF